MRIALVDQMPVGVMGIDDENTIVLVNPKAIEILGVEDIPIWGLSVASLLTDSVGDFVKNESMTEMSMNRYGHNILIRKSPFILEDTFAGTILVLWKIAENQ
jgi:PAS domain-containing protein